MITETNWNRIVFIPEDENDSELLVRLKESIKDPKLEILEDGRLIIETYF